MSKKFYFKDEASQLAFWGIPEPDRDTVINYLKNYLYVCYYKVILFLGLGNPHRSYFGE